MIKGSEPQPTTITDVQIIVNQVIVTSVIDAANDDKLTYTDLITIGLPHHFVQTVTSEQLVVITNVIKSADPRPTQPIDVVRLVEGTLVNTAVNAANSEKLTVKDLAVCGCIDSDGSFDCFNHLIFEQNLILVRKFLLI